jgi:hypothetical protein
MELKRIVGIDNFFVCILFSRKRKERKEISYFIILLYTRSISIEQNQEFFLFFFFFLIFINTLNKNKLHHTAKGRATQQKC